MLRGKILWCRTSSWDISMKSLWGRFNFLSRRSQPFEWLRSAQGLKLYGLPADSVCAFAIVLVTVWANRWRTSTKAELPLEFGNCAFGVATRRAKVEIVPESSRVWLVWPKADWFGRRRSGLWLAPMLFSLSACTFSSKMHKYLGWQRSDSVTHS